MVGGLVEQNDSVVAGNQVNVGYIGSGIYNFNSGYLNVSQLWLGGGETPGVIAGHADAIQGSPFLGHEDARLQVLLPDHPSFDLAVNIFTYEPGATLPFVEAHIMEHGLMMLSGRGIYRLGADRHRVIAGDVIWMASYCPQWFIAQGKTKSSYIYYKDVNRAPL